MHDATYVYVRQVAVVSIVEGMHERLIQDFGRLHDAVARLDKILQYSPASFVYGGSPVNPSNSNNNQPCGVP